jgi:hypothetical protein
MNLSPNDCYVPPIHNPQLIPSSKECLQQWETHRLSLYLLLSQKHHHAFSTTLLSLWLSQYCHTDPLYLSQWFPFIRLNPKKEKGLKELKVPKHIFLWNDLGARLLALYTTHRWLHPLHPNPPSSSSPPLPSVPYRWKPRDHTTEGLLQRWGSLPDCEELPVVIPFQQYHQWPTPWKLLYRGIITGAFYPDDCFFSYHGWNGGWGWILGWTNWAQRSMGQVASRSIFPMITAGIDPLPYGCPHPSWVGLAIGWQLLEILVQQRQYPIPETQNWLMKQFVLARKAWLSPYLFGSKERSTKQTTLLYQFMDWVTWFLLCPEQALQAAQSQQDYMKQNEGDIVRDYIQLGQQYHQYACQDRESPLIQNEFVLLYEPKTNSKTKTKTKQETETTSQKWESSSSVSTSTKKRGTKKATTREIEEEGIPQVILDIPGFIPQRGELGHRKVSIQDEGGEGEEERILDMRKEGRNLGIRKKVEVELESERGSMHHILQRERVPEADTRDLLLFPTINEEEDGEESEIDWGALEEIVSRKKSHKRSSEEHSTHYE